mmetsp:Transcript_7904/g.48850  ORF Transcript_7904/g.48850 Transcript_7904/m.48850 type:complete len:199 (-) Transcript_7904:22-618(-)
MFFVLSSLQWSLMEMQHGIDRPNRYINEGWDGIVSAVPWSYMIRGSGVLVLNQCPTIQWRNHGSIDCIVRKIRRCDRPTKACWNGQGPGFVGEICDPFAHQGRFWHVRPGQVSYESYRGHNPSYETVHFSRFCTARCAHWCGARVTLHHGAWTRKKLTSGRTESTMAHGRLNAKSYDAQLEKASTLLQRWMDGWARSW